MMNINSPIDANQADCFWRYSFRAQNIRQFKTSASEVLTELNKLVKAQAKKQKEPPEEMTSTVKI